LINTTNIIKATLDFNIEKELIEVPAVTLEQPTLHFDKTIVAKKGGSKTDGTKTPELGQWNLQNVRFANTPRSLGKLHMLALEGCLESAANDPLDTAYTTFLAKLAEHGITMGQGTAIHEKDLIAKNPIDAPPFGDEGAIKKFLNKVHTSNSDCSVIVIPEKNYDLYAFTKRLFDFNQRHVLFAVGSKFIEKGAQQFMSNLALKVNMKFGGASHYLSADKLDECLGKGIKNRTIVLGADIGHCGAGGKDGHPSVACVVGSVDNRFMSYPGSMRLQCGGQEVSTRTVLWKLSTNHTRLLRKSTCVPWLKNVFMLGDTHTSRRLGLRICCSIVTVSLKASSSSASRTRSPRSRTPIEPCASKRLT
jgi:hypothetical protein